MNDETKFSHLDEQGRARMVNVGDKPAVKRIATARGVVVMHPSTVEAIRGGTVPKGDVLSVARVAGIQAAKRTGELIPLCHSLPLEVVTIAFQYRDDAIEITASAECHAKTGVEMEALCAVSTAALTIYDMCKAVDKHMRIKDLHLLSKEKIEDEAG